MTLASMACLCLRIQLAATSSRINIRFVAATDFAVRSDSAYGDDDGHFWQLRSTGSSSRHSDEYIDVKADWPEMVFAVLLVVVPALGGRFWEPLTLSGDLF